MPIILVLFSWGSPLWVPQSIPFRYECGLPGLWKLARGFVEELSLFLGPHDVLMNYFTLPR